MRERAVFSAFYTVIVKNTQNGKKTVKTSLNAREDYIDARLLLKICICK